MNVFKLICKILTAISVLPYSLFIMGIAIYILLDTSSFLDRAVKTNGVVIELVSHSHKNTLTSKYSFLDEKGVTYTGVHNVYSRPPIYDIDEPVEVLYDPQFPKRSMIDDGSFRDYFFYALVFIYGLIFFIMAVLILRYL